MSDNEERFGSLARLYGAKDLEKIQQANICVVGIGGVGSWVVEALARSGVQRLTLIDGDDISRSNMNRQCHTLESTIGEMKTEVMKQRVLDINPQCQVQTVARYLDDDNIFELLLPDTATPFDCVIDAIDRIKYKALMIYFCKRNKLPVVTTGGAGGLTDPAQVGIKDLTRTWNDPLAASVRLSLRQQHNFTRNPKRSFGVPCVFSTQQQRYPDKDGCVGYQKPGVAGLSLDCSFGYGSSVAVTATFGFVASAKAIEIVTK
ncbi:MAG: tRNA threonylcarbamoyladenosine dehydratase [Gammaproteobacteria bacterium]|nr:tRNA threonylcarbamoyladenosine dehydratase [Gammaproteobacteria bacterium]NNJ51183.1 tRNA threonylcarbamoyladenosine dehydratase [Gammaproteobacteria bacterium]